MFRTLTQSKKITASGLIFTGECVFRGLLIGTDGTNDPTITVYDNTADSGEEILPTNTYDASALGLNGVVSLDIHCKNGLYVAITCNGTVEVVPMWRRQ